MIRALIFDCFGVLYIDPMNELRAKALPGKQTAVTDARRAYDHGYITADDYLRQLAMTTELSVAELRAFTDRRHMRNDRLLRLIEQLKSDYAIGLLSNMGRDMLDELLTRRQIQLFDTIILSGETGMAKPDPAMFLAAAQRLGVAAGECVMIDDSRVNCDAAISTGMQAVLYEDMRQLVNELRIILKYNNDVP